MKAKISGGVAHSLPKAFEIVLSKTPTALKAWENLTPLARNEWICWITFPKTQETQQKHLLRAITELQQGKRRPCCWIGCTHRTDKKISPSIAAILKKQKRL